MGTLVPKRNQEAGSAIVALLEQAFGVQGRRALAKCLGRSHSYWSKLQNGEWRRTPTWDFLIGKVKGGLPPAELRALQLAVERIIAQVMCPALMDELAQHLPARLSLEGLTAVRDLASRTWREHGDYRGALAPMTFVSDVLQSTDPTCLGPEALRLLLDAQVHLCELRSTLDDRAGALCVAERAVAVARLLGEPTTIAWATHTQAVAHTIARQFDRAERIYADAERRYQTVGRPLAGDLIRLCHDRCNHHFEERRFQTAERVLISLEKEATAAGQSRHRLLVMLRLVDASIALREPLAARRRLNAADHFAKEHALEVADFVGLHYVQARRTVLAERVSRLEVHPGRRRVFK